MFVVKLSWVFIQIHFNSVECPQQIVRITCAVFPQFPPVRADIGRVEKQGSVDQLLHSKYNVPQLLLFLKLCLKVHRRPNQSYTGRFYIDDCTHVQWDGACNQIEAATHWLRSVVYTRYIYYCG